MRAPPASKRPRSFHALTEVDLQAWPDPDRGIAAVPVSTLETLESPGDGSCFASSSWAPRRVAVFRSGIADVRFAGKREPKIPNFRAPRLRSRLAPMASTGF